MMTTSTAESADLNVRTCAAPQPSPPLRSPGGRQRTIMNNESTAKSIDVIELIDLSSDDDDDEQEPTNQPPAHHESHVTQCTIPGCTQCCPPNCDCWRSCPDCVASRLPSNNPNDDDGHNHSGHGHEHTDLPPITENLNDDDDEIQFLGLITKSPPVTPTIAQNSETAQPEISEQNTELHGTASQEKDACGIKYGAAAVQSESQNPAVATSVDAASKPLALEPESLMADSAALPGNVSSRPEAASTATNVANEDDAIPSYAMTSDDLNCQSPIEDDNDDDEDKEDDEAQKDDAPSSSSPDLNNNDEDCQDQYEIIDVWPPKAMIDDSESSSSSSESDDESDSNSSPVAAAESDENPSESDENLPEPPEQGELSLSSSAGSSSGASALSPNCPNRSMSFPTNSPRPKLSLSITATTNHTMVPGLRGILRNPQQAGVGLLCRSNSVPEMIAAHAPKTPKKRLTFSPSIAEMRFFEPTVDDSVYDFVDDEDDSSSSDDDSVESTESIAVPKPAPKPSKTAPKQSKAVPIGTTTRQYKKRSSSCDAAAGPLSKSGAGPSRPPVRKMAAIKDKVPMKAKKVAMSKTSMTARGSQGATCQASTSGLPAAIAVLKAAQPRPADPSQNANPWNHRRRAALEDQSRALDTCGIISITKSETEETGPGQTNVPPIAKLLTPVVHTPTAKISRKRSREREQTVRRLSKEAAIVKAPADGRHRSPPLTLIQKPQEDTPRIAVVKSAKRRAPSDSPDSRACEASVPEKNPKKAALAESRYQKRVRECSPDILEAKRRAQSTESLFTANRGPPIAPSSNRPDTRVLLQKTVEGQQQRARICKAPPPQSPARPPSVSRRESQESGYGSRQSSPVVDPAQESEKILTVARFMNGQTRLQLPRPLLQKPEEAEAVLLKRAREKMAKKAKDSSKNPPKPTRHAHKMDKKDIYVTHGLRCTAVGVSCHAGMFANGVDLEWHLRTDHGIEYYQCHDRGCNSSFKDKKEFEQHLVRKHPAGVQCPYCPELKPLPWHELKDHLSMDHWKGDFRCRVDRCPFQGVTRRALHGHARAHQQLEKRYRAMDRLAATHVDYLKKVVK